jgi:hypothetical protein
VRESISRVDRVSRLRAAAGYIAVVLFAIFATWIAIRQPARPQWEVLSRKTLDEIGWLPLEHIAVWPEPDQLRPFADVPANERSFTGADAEFYIDMAGLLIPHEYIKHGPRKALHVDADGFLVVRLEEDDIVGMADFYLMEDRLFFCVVLETGSPQANSIEQLRKQAMPLIGRPLAEQLEPHTSCPFAASVSFGPSDIVMHSGDGCLAMVMSCALDLPGRPAEQHGD